VRGGSERQEMRLDTANGAGSSSDHNKQQTDNKSDYDFSKHAGNRNATYSEQSSRLR
jgi:hypothetical protein